jgi:hypothetical protein
MTHPPPLRHAALLTLCLSGPLAGFTMCEGEPPAGQPAPSRRAVQAPPTRGALDTSAYTRAGEGPQEAPDWVKSLDPNMMRRANQTPEGYRYGHPFNPSVLIERGEGGWRLVLLERPLEADEQLRFTGQRVEIDLERDPSNELKQSADFDTSRARWRLPLGEVEGQSVEWTAQSAYTLELLEWTLEPFDPKGHPVQVRGRASGRVMLHFKDEAGVQGWVVGRFEEAPVRYLGDPELWAEARR